MSDIARKALESVRGAADEALLERIRALKAPPAPPAQPQEPEFSADEEAELARLYERESAGGGG